MIADELSRCRMRDHAVGRHREIVGARRARGRSGTHTPVFVASFRLDLVVERVAADTEPPGELMRKGSLPRPGRRPRGRARSWSRPRCWAAPRARRSCAPGRRDQSRDLDQTIFGPAFPEHAAPAAAGLVSEPRSIGEQEQPEVTAARATGERTHPHGTGPRNGKRHVGVPADAGRAHGAHPDVATISAELLSSCALPGTSPSGALPPVKLPGGLPQKSVCACGPYLSS